MRRASYTPLTIQTPAEPLIVVEESGGTDDETPSGESSPQLAHPGLLSPYRDMRKHSLPTPTCTSGITASQVRRLSEHGAEGGTAASMREAAFLATLSSAPTPAPGGRRHSVVTISRAPATPNLFGRGRRESIAAFPANSMQATRVLANRRDSTSSVPRPPSASGSTSGSHFNLQLDIMDDIAEIKAARKVRLKMWKTPSRERVCEVQPLDGTAGTSASATRYHQVSPAPSSRADAGATAPIPRRYSDFVPTQSVQHPKRRASEQVPPATSASSTAPPKPSSSTGIVCSNTDLISILSSLASSAQEINKDPEDESAPRVSSSSKGKDSIHEVQRNDSSISVAASADQKRSRLKNLRSNSFDVSMLLGTGVKPKQDAGRCSIAGPTSWFVRRHQPKKSDPPKGQSSVVVSLSQDKPNVIIVQGTDISSNPQSESGQHKTSPPKSPSPPDNKVVWDGKSGSVVDAQVLGSAIEVFLVRRGSGNDSSGGTSPQNSKVSPTKNSGKSLSRSAGAGTSSWFSGNNEVEDEAGASDTCDTSICSTLKDLFVK